jgi:hypothetical protein
VVGSVFSLRLVEDVYPFGDNEGARAEVKAAMEALADQHGLLMKLRASNYNDEYVYRCSEVLLLSTVRHRLLEKHKLALAAKITRARAQYTALTDMLGASPGGAGAPNASRLSWQGGRTSQNSGDGGAAGPVSPGSWLKAGYLLVKKHNGSRFGTAWKERYAALTADSLVIFKKRVDPHKASHSEAKEVIYLNDATVRELDETDKAGGLRGFIVDSPEWSRAGEAFFSQRAFVFASDAKDREAVAQGWLSKLRMTVNKLKLGALIPAKAGERGGANRNTVSLGGALGSKMLAVRKRVDPKAVVPRRADETLLIVTLDQVRRPDGSILPPLAAHERLPQCYATLRLVVADAPRLVRKQALLTPPTSRGMNTIVLEDSFALALTSEVFIDWAVAAGAPERNARVEVLLWRQEEGGLGFDKMIGSCSLSLPELFKTFSQRKKREVVEEMALRWPYAAFKDRGLEAQIVVRCELVISKADQAKIKNLTKGVKRTADSTTTGDELFAANQRLALSVEEAALRRQDRSTSSTSVNNDGLARASSRARDDGNESGDGSSRSLFSVNGDKQPGAGAGAQDKDKEKKGGKRISKPLLRLSKSESQLKGSARQQQSHEAEDQATSANSAKRRSQHAESGALFVASATDAALSHVEFLIGRAESRAESVALEQFKAILLSRSFNSLVNEIKMDETQKLWLTEFTRPENPPVARSSGGKPADARKAPSSPQQQQQHQQKQQLQQQQQEQQPQQQQQQQQQQVRARSESLDDAVDAYLAAASRPLSYLENGQARGPHGLSFYTNKLMKEQLTPALLVFVHAPHSEEVLEQQSLLDELDTKAMVKLGAHLEALSALAQGAAAIVTKHQRTQARKSALAAALLGEIQNRPTRRAAGAAPTRCFQTSQAMSFKLLESSYHAWAKRQKVGNRGDLDISEWHFNLLAVPAELTGHLIAVCFSSFGLEERFAIEPKPFRAFVETVFDAMTAVKNPYHSYEHAVDVFQATFVLLGRMDGSSLLSDVEILGLLISSLCHDLYHPGTNNRFQQLTNSELALKYERAPLESHHAASTLNLLRNDETNFLGKLKTDEMDQVKLIVVNSILATDMSAHFGLAEELRTVVVRNSDDPAFDLSDADKMVIIKTIVHCADLSNPSRAWEVSHRWQQRILEEFFAQGDKERALGFDVSPGMDRKITKMEELAVSFIDFIVAPLYVNLASLLPKTACVCVQLDLNRRRWVQVVEDNARKLAQGEARDKALEQVHNRSKAFEEILANAGFTRDDKDGALTFSAARSRRKNTLYTLEALATAAAHDTH